MNINFKNLSGMMQLLPMISTEEALKHISQLISIIKIYKNDSVSESKSVLQLEFIIVEFDLLNDILSDPTTKSYDKESLTSILEYAQSFCNSLNAELSAAKFSSFLSEFRTFKRMFKNLIQTGNFTSLFSLIFECV